MNVSAWFCFDVVRRHSVLVPHGSLRIMKTVGNYWYLPAGILTIDHFTFKTDQGGTSLYRTDIFLNKRVMQTKQNFY